MLTRPSIRLRGAAGVLFLLVLLLSSRNAQGAASACRTYFYADQAAKHYTTETVVRSSARVAVTAHTSITVQGGGNVGSASATGITNAGIATAVTVSR